MSETPLHALVAPMELEPIKARCDAATYGPWHAENAETRGDGSAGCAWGVVSDTRLVIMHDFVAPLDAEFIAHARMDVPNLVREVERLRALLLTAGPPETKVAQSDEALEAAAAQLLIEIAFLLPIGTNVRQHPIAKKLLEYTKTVRASVQVGPQETPQGWQPIETAPKDGTPILACKPSWTHPYVFCYLNGPGLLEGWHDFNISASGRRPHGLTHWMPLPAPPPCGTLCETEEQL